LYAVVYFRASEPSFPIPVSTGFFFFLSSFLFQTPYLFTAANVIHNVFVALLLRPFFVCVLGCWKPVQHMLFLPANAVLVVLILFADAPSPH